MWNCITIQYRHMWRVMIGRRPQDRGKLESVIPPNPSIEVTIG